MDVVLLSVVEVVEREVVVVDCVEVERKRGIAVVLGVTIGFWGLYLS